MTVSGPECLAVVLNLGVLGQWSVVLCLKLVAVDPELGVSDQRFVAVDPELGDPGQGLVAFDPALGVPGQGLVAVDPALGVFAPRHVVSVPT